MKWDKVKLREVTTLTGGYAFKSSKMKDECLPGYRPVVKIGNVSVSGKLDLNSVQYHEFSKELESFSIKKGDILIAMTGATVGKVSVSTYNDLLLNQRVGLIRPKAGLISQRFLHHSLCNQLFYDYCQFTAGGGAQGNISPSQILEYHVPLPPLHIQEQIADTLDKADALRRKDQELLQKYDQLAQAIFYDMFGDPVRNDKGWKKSTLEGLINIDTKSIKPEDTVGRNYVGLENIEKESGDITQSKDVDLRSNKFLFDPTCILYGKLRPYLRKVATPNFDGVCSTDIFPIRCKGLEKEFAATILRSEHFTDYANSSSVGANLPRVNKDAILSYETICPPMRLQENYSVKINQIKQLKSVVNTSRVAHENMQSSLFKRFFS